MPALAFGVLLAVMGLASIWAFVSPKYQNAPENITPLSSHLLAPPLAPLRLNPASPSIS